MLGIFSTALLACALLLPSAAPVAAEPVCPTMGHFFTVTVSFPAGYWDEGTHALTFTAIDKRTGEVIIEPPPYYFDVDADAALYRGQVLLTPADWEGGDLELLAAGGVYLDAVDPDQPTVARFIVAVEPADLDFLVWARSRTVMTISWDGGPAVQGLMGGLSSLCVYGGPGKTTMAEWLRAFGAFQT